jgi:hypothetical protein
MLGAQRLDDRGDLAADPGVPAVICISVKMLKESEVEQSITYWARLSILVPCSDYGNHQVTVLFSSCRIVRDRWRLSRVAVAA